MRKLLKISVLALFFGLLGFLLYKTYAKINKNRQIAENIQSLPAFYFYDLNDSLFTDARLQPDKALLIIHFHPECEFCRHEAQLIAGKINNFAPYQLLFVSYAEKKQIKDYAYEFKLSGYPNIIFLQDKDMVFTEIFGKSGIPTSFIYDKNQKLIKKFKGETKAEALLKYLEK